MSWLVANGRVLASAEIAEARRDRRRGLLGRDGLHGALVLTPCRWVHTFGMRFAIDVAHLDRDGVVLCVTTMARHRVGRPVVAARSVIEASSGAFDRWGLCVGDVVEVRTTVDEPRCGPGRPSPASAAERTPPSGTLRTLVAEPVGIG